MKINRYIFISAIAGIFLFLILNKKGNTDTTQPISQSTRQPRELSDISSYTDSYGSQTKTFGAVEVEVKPKQLTSGKEAVFYLSLNTHSVDLSYDYTKIALLIDNQDNTYDLVSWSGGRGGHHLEGELTFEPLKDNIKNITLALSGIDGESHNFSWSINRNIEL